MPLVDPEMLALLRCPLHPDTGELREVGERLVCPQGHAYPVVDGIPHLLPEDAQTVEEAREEAPNGQ